MADRIANKVKMEGITRLPLFSEEKDGNGRYFDFNKIIPMPKSLDVEKGSVTNWATVYYMTDRCRIPLSKLGEEQRATLCGTIDNYFCDEKWLQNSFMHAMEYAFERSDSEKDKFFELGKTYVTNKLKYGHATWYGWRCENWGTKWNSYNFEEMDDDTILFDTANGVPEPVLKRLSEIYPESIIEHWWTDEGDDESYHQVYRNGDMLPFNPEAVQ